MTDDSDSLYEPIALTFSYRHAYGALRPFLDGLREGRAVGVRCPACRRIWFPPRLQCVVDGVPTEPVVLSGRGHILVATAGPVGIPLTGKTFDASWALVQVDGAENAIVARVLAEDGRTLQPGARVMLMSLAAPAPHPAQHAVFKLAAAVE